MRIETVETKTADIAWTSHFSRKQLFVRITTDEGLTGIGESWAGAPTRPVEAVITDLLKPLILGEDSSRIEHLWQKMYRGGYRYGTEGVVSCAMSGVDLALWDLLGKRHDVPVARLLGGQVKDRVRVYASFPELRDERLLTETLERMLGAGYTGVKLHDRDEKLIALTREVVGNDFTIMLDPTGQWSMHETEEMIQRLERYNLLWIEEPIFPMQDHASLCRLRRNSTTKFAAGENEYNLSGYYRLMQSGAVDYVQPELSKMGGLTTARKLTVLGELFNYTLCPHCYITGPASYAGIQLGFTQENMDWHEVKWIPAGLESAVVPPLEVTNGHVELPRGPGLGLPPIDEVALT